MARFQKGRSGNPAGRPKKRRPNVSAFDIVFDKTLMVTQDGTERELSAEEALEHQTLQAAFKGNRTAIRQVLKMIARREAALEKRRPAKKPVEVKCSYSSNNARRALSLLDIAHPDAGMTGADPETVRMFLEPWVVQAALVRPGGRPLAKKDLDACKFFTRDSKSVRWPQASDQ